MAIYPRGGIALPGSSLNFKTGSWRLQKPVHQHRVAPCAQACPAGEDPQAYLAQVAEGDWQGAWQTVVAANPLPAITGRVCPHPCESGCNRQYYDSALGIHSVERFLGDMAIQQQWSFPAGAAIRLSHTVAVVGAGPAGLAAAYHLHQLGYAVTLFEALAEAGGLLLSAIPAYRLPKTTVAAEINRLLALGIVWKPHHRLGREFSLAELTQDYSAVVLAPGQQSPSPWSVNGVTPQDLHQGLDLLKQWSSVGSLPEWQRVAVIGAGNTAIDTARVLKWAGVREVHVISHKALPAPNVPPEDTMPAIAREIALALEEGVQIHPHRGVRRLILRGEKVVGIELVHMKKLANAQGRLRRVAFEGTETVLTVDQVIPAVGQILDNQGMESVLPLSGFSLDAKGQLPKQALWVCGDASGRAGTVTAAVGEGRRAAWALAAYVQQQPLPDEPEPAVTSIAYNQLNLNYYEPAPRAEEALLPLAERSAEREIELGLTQAQVLAEAHRCFSCGNCLACDNCWTLCPDSAVLKTKHTATDGSHYQFDYEYCKGCGLCAQECPCGYIQMVE